MEGGNASRAVIERLRHRVVGCHNRLTGYAAGIARKQSLLKLEQQNR